MAKLKGVYKRGKGFSEAEKEKGEASYRVLIDFATGNKGPN